MSAVYDKESGSVFVNQLLTEKDIEWTYLELQFDEITEAQIYRDKVMLEARTERRSFLKKYAIKHTVLFTLDIITALCLFGKEKAKARWALQVALNKYLLNKIDENAVVNAIEECM